MYHVIGNVIVTDAILTNSINLFPYIFLLKSDHNLYTPVYAFLDIYGSLLTPHCDFTNVFLLYMLVISLMFMVIYTGLWWIKCHLTSVLTTVDKRSTDTLLTDFGSKSLCLWVANFYMNLKKRTYKSRHVCKLYDKYSSLF